MPVFFIFSDEAGGYRRDRTDPFIRTRPYYCRSAVMLDSQDWIRLKDEFYTLKRDLLGLDEQQEIKWSYIWSLYKHRKNKEAVPNNRPYYFLRNHSINDLIEFVRKTLNLLNLCESCRIVYTITINDRNKTPRILERNIIKMHLQNIMQRIEMEIQSGIHNLAVIFFDPVNRKIDKIIRNSYHDIYSSGDFIEKYCHIKDSISLELSHHSFGIQLADYCAGILDNVLKNYGQSIELFRDQIWPHIRKDDNNVFGYGICEIPKHPENREYLRKIIADIFREETEEEDIPF